MSAEIIATRRTYAGLFMVALATLMYEVLLTRIFSVTLWYHHSFMVVSMAMFGMTVGAMQVYLDPKYRESTKYQLARSALLFSGTIVLGFVVHVSIPSAIYRSAWGPIAVGITYGLISVPFGFSGICVCLALTRFPRQVSTLYAADLVGAALGCVLLVYTLEFADAPAAVVLVAFLAAIAAVLLFEQGVSSPLKRVAYVLSLSLLILAGVNGIMAARQAPLLRLKWVKSAIEDRPLYEKWNSFSRVRVYSDPDRLIHPYGWGLSSTLPAGQKARQLMMDIDACAATVLTGFHGDLSELEYLKYDVTNLGHYIRSGADVLVVGAGGGRDILSALVFRQKSVVGVEINQNIIDTVNRKFGDFTGHLDRAPGVTLVADEARSYVARSRSRFDIIQISLIDTYAATAAGAFVLTENSVYTVEAWKLFLEHLTPRGVLSVSRWYSRDEPGETYRLVSLASTALKELGARDPRDHILVVFCAPADPRQGPRGIATLLLAREPFSRADLESLAQVSERMRFDVLLSPSSSADPVFAALAAGGDLRSFLAKFPLNITAPTDDNPFFYNMLRFRNAFDPELWRSGRDEPHSDRPNLRGVGVLVGLLITIPVLSYLYIFAPLLRNRTALQARTCRPQGRHFARNGPWQKGAWPLLVFFSMIGLGYMLVEVSQMERLMIFLGHPTYGLSVVLFALLLASGLGSHSTARLGNAKRQAALRVVLLVLALAVFGKLTPHIVQTFQASATPLRLLVAAAILFPPGFLMGMAFPLGMKLASIKSPSITPALWAVNGAGSVFASVLAITIALAAGISTSFWTGFTCYAVGAFAFVYASRST